MLGRLASIRLMVLVAFVCSVGVAESFAEQRPEEPQILPLHGQLEELLASASSAWAAGKFADVRDYYGRIVAAPDAPAQFRSVAHLRLAQSYLV